MLAALILLLAWSGQGVATDRPALPPTSVFFSAEGPGSAGQAVIAPNVVVEGEPLGAPTTQGGPEECSAVCRAGGGDCDWFRFCDSDDGCPEGGADGAGLAFQACLLLRANCSLQPVVQPSSSDSHIMSGFPVRQAPMSLSGFTPLAAQGILGGDYECPESLLPGACAIRGTLTAASTCIRSPECRAVTVYQNGTDGCSGQAIALLKAQGLSPANGFISPSTYTLLVAEAQSQESNFWLLAGEGEVVVAPEAAQAGADADATVGLTAWKGAIVARGAVMGGAVVGVVDGVATAEECARECHRRGAGAANFSGGCNVVNHCHRQGGCRYQDADLSREEVALGRGQCELRSQELAMPSIGSPPVLLGKGAGVEFSVGAPLVEWGPELAGYQRHPGRSLFASGRFQCEGSLRPQAQECVLEGSPSTLAAACDSAAQCAAFLLKPGYIVDGQPTLAPQGMHVGILKDAVIEPSAWVLNPTTTLYVQDGSGGGGGLSAGAIAGIAVGCAAGVAATAAAAWLLARRRWRRQRQPGAVAAAPGALKSHKSGSVSTQEDGAEACEAGEGKRGGFLPRAVQVAPQQQAAKPSPFVSTAAAAPGAAPGPSFSSGQSGGSGGSSSMERPAGSAPRRGSAGAQPFPGAANRAPLAPGVDPLCLSTAALSAALSSGAMSPVVAAAAARSQQVASGDGASASASGSSAQLAPAGDALDPQAGRGAALPELVQHVAVQDALALTAGATSSRGSSERGAAALSVEALPPRLREWVVDPGEYEVMRWPNGKPQEIGAGASAHVYKVLYNGEVVAAKEMDIEASAAMQEAFLKEAVWLHALRHPNIVAFFGCSISGSKGTVLVEYCDGRDLYSALQVKAAGSNQRLFAWQRRGRRVAYEIAKALNYLHSKGVVHMDIKSSNVLLTANGAVRVTDVGFSRQKTHTVLSNVPLVGTFAWIAPEILTGKQQVTEEVDIYSFGVVLWEIITGERPQRGKLRAPRVPEECPQAAADLMQECVSETPSSRPSASQLLKRLGQLLEKPKPGAAASRKHSDGAAEPAVDAPLGSG